jgi:hypothetical protein
MGVRGCDRGHQRSGGTRCTFDLSMASMCPTAKCRISKNKRLDDGIPFPSVLAPDLSSNGQGQNPESRRNENGRWLLPPSDQILTLHPHYHPRHSACPGVSTPNFSMFGTCEIMSLLTLCPFDMPEDKHNTLRRILRACTAPSRVTSRRQQS